MARRLLALLDGLLNLMTMLVIVVVGAYAGYALWDNGQIYASVENVQEDLLVYKQKAEEDHANIGLMFEELKTLNSDVIAWLTLDNTHIDYPVLIGEDNYEYLNRDVYGKFALAGSIFADCRCDPNFSDAYTLVHGHHMAEGRMFGDLDLYKNRVFFEENRTGMIYLPDRTYDLKTVACMVVKATDQVIFVPDRWQDDIEDILEYIKDNSLHNDEQRIDDLLDRNAAAKEGGVMPKIIALATCSSEYNDARTIVVAEMIPREESKNGEEEE